MPTTRCTHSLLRLISSLANARHIEARELAAVLADAGNPNLRPLLRVVDGEKFEIIKASQL